MQGLDEADEERKMENLYTGQGVGADEDGDDDEDEADGNVSVGVSKLLWEGNIAQRCKFSCWPNICMMCSIWELVKRYVSYNECKTPHEIDQSATIWCCKL